MTYRNHLYILIFCSTILLLSFFLTIDGGSNVCLPILNKYPIHGICLFKEIFGIDCPTCGLTRSFISISHLHFENAWDFNRASIFIYVFVLFQIPYRICLIWKKQGLITDNYLKTSRSYSYVVAIILIANWFLELI